MASSPDSISMALFCDFENVALGVRDANYEKFDIKRVLERLLLKGSIVVKKAYCDWDRYKSFKAAMHEANFELIEIPHVRQSGKNSADIRLVVDALDLCYTKSHVDTFVIISGDSDFSPLVSKLRENAKQVIGVGVKQSTSDLLIANCDEFIFYDDLVRDSQRAAAKRDARDSAPAPKRSPEEEKRRKDEIEGRRRQAIDIAVETFEALLAERGESGKIWASMLKEAIKRRKPDFNESYFGFRAFGNLLEEAQSRGLLELGRDEKSGTYVSRPSAAVLSAAAENEAAQMQAATTAEAQQANAEATTEDKPAQAGKASARSGRRRGSGRAAAQAEGRPAAPSGRGGDAGVVQVEHMAQAVADVTQAPVVKEVSPPPAEGQAATEGKVDQSVALEVAAPRAEPKKQARRARKQSDAPAEAGVAAASERPATDLAPAAVEEVPRKGRKPAARGKAKPAQAPVAELAAVDASTPKGSAGKVSDTKTSGTKARRPARAAEQGDATTSAVTGGEPVGELSGEGSNTRPAAKTATRSRRPRKPKADAAE